MRCLHPHCPAGSQTSTWSEVLDELAVATSDRTALLLALSSGYGKLVAGLNPAPQPAPTSNAALLRRLVAACPCLVTQMLPHPSVPTSPRAIVHLCELTMGKPVSSSSAHDAFLIQHPDLGPDFLYEPLKPCSDGGGIMEMICSEVLASEGVPRMEVLSNGPDRSWPKWEMPGHVLLNEGAMNAHRAFGDILIPCAPTNLIVSVKSVKARERLLYSSNAIEGIGFGFFDEPQEFWSPSRMNLYKRMGFTAIYMPAATLGLITDRLMATSKEALAVNINGTALYRDLKDFGPDMRRIVGKSSLTL